MSIERDGFSAQTLYIAEPLENEDDDQGTPDAESVAELYLSAERFPDGTIRYYINVVNDYRHNLRDFLFAIDSDGYKLRGNWIAHQLNCRAFCRYDEHLQIELNGNYLRDKARTGLKFRLYGPPMKAFAPVHVAGAYISSFLASVDGIH